MCLSAGKDDGLWLAETSGADVILPCLQSIGADGEESSMRKKMNHWLGGSGERHCFCLLAQIFCGGCWEAQLILSNQRLNFCNTSISYLVKLSDET